MAPPRTGEFRKVRPAPMGWDPKEPMLLAVGLVLVLAAGFFPWWGVAEDISVFPYNTTAGTDLGLWVSGDWQLQILPGAVFRRGTSSLWWEFAPDHPEFSGYGAAAPAACALWAGALVAGGRALSFRYRPRSRQKGRATAFETIATAVGGLVLVVVAVGFPAGTDYSFVGTEGRFTWGPHVGWVLALIGVGLISGSTAIGWISDRSLRGRCWKCYQGTTARVCDYCGAAQ